MTEEQPNTDVQEPADGVGPAGDSLEALRAQTATLKDQALRYAADAENTRRRAEREINDARAYAISKFAKDLLGVADNLARALDHAPKDAADPAVRSLAVGLEMTQKDLASAFERNGLKKLEPEIGAKFDPHQHQAMMEQASDSIAPGAIVKVLQVGYELFGRIVRPALVVVAARGEGAGAGQESAGDDQRREDAEAVPGPADPVG